MTINPISRWAQRLFLLAVAYSVSRTSFGLTSDEFCDDVFYLTNYVLTVEEGVDDFAKGFQSARRRTNDEMAEELIFIFHVLDGNADMAGSRRFTVELLSDFPTTNSIPFLIQVFQEEDNLLGGAALSSYLRLQGFSQGSLAAVGDFFDKNPRSGHRISAFSQISHELEYEKHSAETRDRMLNFILQRTERGDIYGTWLDDILCRHLDGYATSDERRQNLNKLLDNPLAFESTVEKARSRLLDMDRPSEPPKSELEGVSHEEMDAEGMKEGQFSVLETNPASEMSPSRHPSHEETPSRSRFRILVLVVASLLGLFLSLFPRRFHKAGGNRGIPQMVLRPMERFRGQGGRRRGGRGVR